MGSHVRWKGPCFQTAHMTIWQTGLRENAAGLGWQAYLHDGYWEDISTLSKFYEVCSPTSRSRRPTQHTHPTHPTHPLLCKSLIPLPSPHRSYGE